MQRSINNKLRIVLRNCLGFLSRITLEKHKPKVIAILGDNSSSLVRELIYSYINSNHKVRRNIENTYSEFSIPLTIFGTLYYPDNLFSWLKVILKTSFQYFYLKPYSHFLILQIHFIDDKIFSYWLNAINADLIIDTDNYKTDAKNKISLTKSDVTKISSNYLPEKVISGLSSIGVKKASRHLLNLESPQTRIRILPAKNKSIILDASHFYYPVNLESVLELAESFPGDKYFYSSNKDEYKLVPKNYRKVYEISSLIPAESIIIIRGSKDKSSNIIKSLALNDFES